MKRIILILTVLLSVLLYGAPTIDELCTNVKAYHEGVEDYTCYIQIFTAKGNKSTNIKWDYKFMKPKYIRMESVEGDRKGDRAYYDYETKKVTGRRGGILGAVKLTLPLSNSLVQNIRGVTIADSDWFHVIERLKAIIAEDLTEYEISDVKYKGNDAVELHVTGIPFDKYNFDELRIFFNEEGHILGFIHYEENTVAEDVFYSNVKINTGLEMEDMYVK